MSTSYNNSVQDKNNSATYDNKMKTIYNIEDLIKILRDYNVKTVIVEIDDEKKRVKIVPE